MKNNNFYDVVSAITRFIEEADAKAPPLQRAEDRGQRAEEAEKVIAAPPDSREYSRLV